MITQIVRCDQCNAVMADGKHRLPLIITLMVDRATENTPPVVSTSHFCSKACVEAALNGAPARNSAHAPQVGEAAHAVAS